MLSIGSPPDNLLQELGQNLQTHAVIHPAVKLQIRPLATFLLAPAANQFNLCDKTVLLQVRLDELEILSVSPSEAGAPHADFYSRLHRKSPPINELTAYFMKDLHTVPPIMMSDLPIA